jgi:hypothetical protein
MRLQSAIYPVNPITHGYYWHLPKHLYVKACYTYKHVFIISSIKQPQILQKERCEE